jgi:protein TonB
MGFPISRTGKGEAFFIAVLMLSVFAHAALVLTGSANIRRPAANDQAAHNLTFLVSAVASAISMDTAAQAATQPADLKSEPPPTTLAPITATTGEPDVINPRPDPTPVVDRHPPAPLEKPAVEPGKQPPDDAPDPAVPQVTEGPAPEERPGRSEELKKLLEEIDKITAEDMTVQGQRYFDTVRRMIKSRYFVPESVTRLKLKGEALVQVTILPNGTIKETALLKRSGYQVLDDMAKKIIESAAPFPAFKDVVDLEYVKVNVPVKW